MITRNEITLVKSLADRAARRQSGLFVAEGKKAVDEMVSSPFRVRMVYSTRQAEYPGVELMRISERDMERLSHLRTPSDTLALVEIPVYDLDPAALAGGLTIALDGVQDPGNVGTIIRLADWFGVRDVLCSPLCADCFNPKVVQATMGAITRVRVHYGDLGRWLEGAGVPVYGTFMDGEAIFSAPLSASGIVALGNEGRGIGPETEALIARRLAIPRFPVDGRGSESLNVATAAGIVLAEFRRRLLDV